MSHVLLVDILEGFLGEHRKHNEDSGQVSFDCPACSEDKGLIDSGDGKGNLEINYDKGVFRCWSCHDVNNMHGPILKLLKRYGSPKNTRDYLLVKPDANIISNREREKIIVEIPEGYKELSKCTVKDYKSDVALDYLHKRGITDEIIKEFKIGYTINGDYNNRVIIPSFSSDGVLNYFVARWFLNKKTGLKYLNPQAEKEEIIFGESKLNFDSTIYIVEGVTDHIVTPNSVPLLGKYINDKLIEMLHDNAMGFIVIVLDGDAFEDAKNLYQKLNFGDLMGRVKIVSFPDGYDPSKIHQLLGAKGITKLLMGARFLKESEER